MDMSTMPQATPASMRPHMQMELFDTKIVSSPFRFEMASVVKDPKQAEHRKDRAYLYMRHLRWYIGGRYYSQIEVVGLYAEINRTVYQDGYLPDGADICVVNFGPDPMLLDTWVAVGAQQAAAQFPKKAGRFNICLLDSEGNPIIPEALTKEAMEQAFSTIVTSFKSEEKQELATLVKVEGGPDLGDRAAIPVTSPQVDTMKAKVEHSTGKKIKQVAAPAAQLPPS